MTSHLLCRPRIQYNPASTRRSNRPAASPARCSLCDGLLDDVGDGHPRIRLSCLEAYSPGDYLVIVTLCSCVGRFLLLTFFYFVDLCSCVRHIIGKRRYSSQAIYNRPVASSHTLYVYKYIYIYIYLFNTCLTTINTFRERKSVCVLLEKCRHELMGPDVCLNVNTYSIMHETKHSAWIILTLVFADRNRDPIRLNSII